MYRLRGFAEAFPYAIGGEVNPEETYIKTKKGGFVAPTSYFCKLTGSKTVGEAFLALSDVADANRRNENRLF